MPEDCESNPGREDKMKLTKAQLFILIRLIVDLDYNKGEEG